MTLILDEDDPLNTLVITRDGCEVLISSISDIGLIDALVNISPHRCVSRLYYLDGRFHKDKDSEWDLINASERVTIWINFYADGVATYHDTEEDSLCYDSDCIARKEITFIKGQGLKGRTN